MFGREKMVEKGTQTFFVASKSASIFREVEENYQEQKQRIHNFINNEIKPTNDLWIAAMFNMLGKIARSVEDKDEDRTKKLLTKFVSQIFIWIEFLDSDAFDELCLEEEIIQNPIYNTIFIKLSGKLSKLILQKRDNKEVTDQLVIINSYCTYWRERITAKNNAGKLSRYQKLSDDFLEEIDEYFAQE